MKVATASDMMRLGEAVASRLHGGECIELVGDIGAGKTTFVQGMGVGLEVIDDVQSPSFTISREYECRDNLRLVHYDFYRLQEAGVIAYELAESLSDPQAITVIEWAKTINAVLPDNRIVVTITSDKNSEARTVDLRGLSL